jgi:hypothetical protein
VGLIEKPLAVVHRWPHQTLAAARVDRDVSHTGTTRLPVVAVFIDGHGPSSLRALFAPLATAFDALLGTVSDDI